MKKLTVWFENGVSSNRMEKILKLLMTCEAKFYLEEEENREGGFCMPTDELNQIAERACRLDRGLSV